MTDTRLFDMALLLILAERALGFERFSGMDRESGWFPGEEDVLDIAAAWGVDPKFQKEAYPPSVGWVCD